MRIRRPIMIVTRAIWMIFRIFVTLNPFVFGLRTTNNVQLLRSTSTCFSPSFVTKKIREGDSSSFQRTRRIRHSSVTSITSRYWTSFPFPSRLRCSRNRPSCTRRHTKTTQLFTQQQNTDSVQKKTTSNPTIHIKNEHSDSTTIKVPWIEDSKMDTKLFVQSQPQQQPYKNLTKTRRNTNNTFELLPNNVSTAWNYSDATLLTKKDLEQYLQNNEFITKKELLSSLDTITMAQKQRMAEEGFSTRTKSASATVGDTSRTRSTSSYAPTKGTVGFPQQSELTDTLLIRCTAFTTGLITLLISRSVAANLWLLGFIIGVIYGNQVATHEIELQRSLSMISAEGGTLSSSRSNGITSQFILVCGRRLGRAIVTTYDAIHVLWYMYKTGKLSYAYYKQYEALDTRFQITDKIDAWNTRFQEGKLKFDAWEKEHEISRKLLAGLRTFWTVEEQSLKRTSKKFSPKRKIALAVSNIYTFVIKLLHALWKLMVGGGNTELNSLLKGIQADFNELNFEKVGQQIGSGLSALVAINIVGTLFLKSPALLGIVCFVGGMIWPTWIGGAYNRLIKKVSDTANKGRQVMALNQSATEGGKYNYFIRDDGTKRWYRTAGTSASSPLDGFLFFKGEPTTKPKGNNISSFFDTFLRRSPSEVKAAKIRKL